MVEGTGLVVVYMLEGTGLVDRFGFNTCFVCKGLPSKYLSRRLKLLKINFMRVS